MSRILVVAFVATCCLSGQPTRPAAFEVASVKRVEPEPNVKSCMCEPKGRIAYSSVALKWIIERAYNLQPPQIVGPDWLEIERYNVDATLPDGASGQDVPVMLRRFLADRFQLATHTDERIVRAFTLVVSKTGSKLQLAKPDYHSPLTMSKTGMHLKERMTMVNLAHYLSLQLQSPVADETKLEGLFAVALDFWPEYLPPRPAVDDVEPDPPLAVAVQQQLGLRLEERKAPNQVLVIDHISKIPTEN